MIPGVGIDTSFFRQKKGELEEEAKDINVPGFFSPRPCHSRSCSTTSLFVEQSFSAKAPTRSSLTDVIEDQHERRAKGGSLTVAAAATPPSPRETGLSPERFLRFEASASMLSPIKEPEIEGHAGCSVLLKTMLADNERMQSRAASVRRVCATALFCDSGRCGGAVKDCHASTNSADVYEKLTLCEAYVSGRSFQSVVCDAQSVNYMNPSFIISALTASNSGRHVALGDRSGRVVVMRRRDSRHMEKERCTEDVAAGDEGRVHHTGKCTLHVCEPYEFAAGRQAYTFVIDPLNSVEVTPCIQALCFLPQVGPTAYLLTANEKLLKLFKVLDVGESSVPFSTVDWLKAKNTGLPILTPGGVTSRTTTIKEASRYALNHEYNINSICPVADCPQFFSADDLSVKLWCIGYSDTSIETYTLKSPFDDEVHETITGIRSFSQEPFLVFILTSSGEVRVVDTRQTLNWLHQTPLVFKNTHFLGDSVLSNCLSDCAFSSCGRYVAGRDVMSTFIWDIRRAVSQNQSAHERLQLSSSLKSHDDVCNVVQRWELYPHMRQDIEHVLQGNTMAQFSVRFLNNNELCTGGFGNALYVVDILGSNTMCNDVEHPTACHNGIQALQLPELCFGLNSGEICGGPLRSLALDKVGFQNYDSSETPFNNTVTQLSYPFRSDKGDCCLLASRGQTLFQLAYSNVNC